MGGGNHKAIGFVSDTGLDPLKNHKIQFWAVTGQPAKHGLAGGLMMARFKWYLDPLSPHQLKKNGC